MKIIAGVALLLVLAGCAYQPEAMQDDAPGFFTGLLHGLIILPTMVIGFFTDVRVYAFPNSGHWYDVGFCIGTLMLVGAFGPQR